MLHKFIFDGVRIVLDVHSGAVHVVDELTWELLDRYEQTGRAALEQDLAGQFDAAEIKAAINEIDGLVQAGLLFSPDPYQGHYEPRAEPVIKAMCLHVAHDCNLSCKYCFAGQGHFGGDSGIMSLEVGRRAIDLLLKNSGTRRHIEVDFFGGEPLLNMPLVKDLVPYGRNRAAELGKQIKFTLTTNALLLDREIQDYLYDHNISVVLSLDGRPEIHDTMRTTINGKGSYQIVMPHIQEYVRRNSPGGYYVRGTFTRHNLDFSRDVMHMAELGFKEVSVEPVVAEPEAEYALQEEDLPVIFNEYEKLTRQFLEMYRQGREINFFHFNIDLLGGPCLPKRLSGCGAGQEYVAVTPTGELYPCHQFVGRTEYCLGDVVRGVVNPELVNRFRQAHVYNKEGCADCWAKFYCSGGCHANAEAFNGDILKPFRQGCVLAQKRFECAIYLQVKKAGLS